MARVRTLNRRRMRNNERRNQVQSNQAQGSALNQENLQYAQSLVDELQVDADVFANRDYLRNELLEAIFDLSDSEKQTVLNSFDQKFKDYELSQAQTQAQTPDTEPAPAPAPEPVAEAANSTSNTIETTADNVLLKAFDKLFKSQNGFQATQAIIFGSAMLRFLDPETAIPAEPERLLHAVSERLNAVISTGVIKDTHLVDFLINHATEENLCFMGSSLVSKIMKSPAYQAINSTNKQDFAKRKAFEKKVDAIYGFNRAKDVAAIDDNKMVMESDDMRDMIKYSAGTDKEKNTANENLDQALDDFDKKYKDVNLGRLMNGPRYYGNVFTPFRNFQEELNAVNRILYGEQRGKELSTEYDGYLRNQKQSAGSKNAYILAQAMDADATTAAIFKRRHVNPKDHPNAFIGRNIDGGTKENPRYLTQLAQTAGMAFVVGLGVGALSHLPVIGQAVGPLMAVYSLYRKGKSEYLKAKAIANGEKLTAKEKFHVAINTAAAAGPYALSAVFGPLGRDLAAIGKMSISFVKDVNAKRARLAENEKLHAKDYLSSLGKAVLNGTVLWASSNLGSAIGSGIGQGLTEEVVVGVKDDGQLRTEKVFKDRDDISLKEIGGNIKENLYNNFVEQQKPKVKLAKVRSVFGRFFGHHNAEEVVAAEDQQAAEETNAAQQENQETQGTQQEQGNQETQENAVVADKISISADEAHLQEIRNQKFELTDNARATANPANGRMYVNGVRQDWYSQDEYETAVKTLHEAGIDDADGALRNLAGARMFKGGVYKTELDQLLHGNLTNKTIDAILHADRVMLNDEADLIVSVPSGHEIDHAQDISGVTQESGVAQEKVVIDKFDQTEVKSSSMPAAHGATTDIMKDETFEEKIEASEYEVNDSKADESSNTTMPDKHDAHDLNQPEEPTKFTLPGNRGGAIVDEDEWTDSLESVYDHAVGNNSAVASTEEMDNSEEQLAGQKDFGKSKARVQDLSDRIKMATGKSTFKGRVIGNRIFIDEETGERYDLQENTNTVIQSEKSVESQIMDELGSGSNSASASSSSDSHEMPAGRTAIAEETNEDVATQESNGAVASTKVFPEPGTSHASQDIMNGTRENLDKWEFLNDAKKARVTSYMERVCSDLDRFTARILDKGLAQSVTEARAGAYKEFIDTNAEDYEFLQDNYFKYAGFDPKQELNTICAQNNYNVNDIKTFWGEMDKVDSIQANAMNQLQNGEINADQYIKQYNEYRNQYENLNGIERS